MIGTAQCPDCGTHVEKLQPGPVRVKHNADGTHTFEAVTPPKPRNDPKPRGRRRG